jgi:hypothetical protein
MLIKEQIKLNYNDMNLKFNLNSNTDLTGYQQEIDKYTTTKSDNLINPINDLEIKRFKLSKYTEIFFYFNNNGSYGNNYINAGFSQTEINSNASTILNSFYILDVYDSYNQYNQNKLGVIYMTKIYQNINNGIVTYTTLPTYYINDGSSQFYYLNLPKYYLNQFTGNTISIYGKFSFFQAKDGVLKPFYNDFNKNIPMNPIFEYVKIDVDLVNKTWNFNDYTNNKGNLLTFYEIATSTSNNNYVDKINSDIETIDDVKPVYPIENNFDYTTGDYKTV